MKRHIIVWLAVLSGFSGAILAAEPPSLINLQGVLRDAVGSRFRPTIFLIGSPVG